MDMIVQFLRWDRAETERGCYGVILPILMVAASARIFLTLEESLVHKEGLLVDQYGRIPYVHRIKMLNVQSQIHRMWKCCPVRKLHKTREPKFDFCPMDFIQSGHSEKELFSVSFF